MTLPGYDAWKLATPSDAKRNVADFVAQAQMIETPATVQIGGR